MLNVWELVLLYLYLRPLVLVFMTLLSRRYNREGSDSSMDPDSSILHPLSAFLSSDWRISCEWDDVYLHAPDDDDRDFLEEANV